MEVYFYHIVLLSLMIVLNSTVHAVLIDKKISGYFSETKLKDWISNLKTILIWGAGASLVFLLTQNGLTALKINSTASMTLNIVWFTIIFFGHGVYIYFSHRSLHQIRFLRKFHATHHVGREQSPLSSWDIHPVEAFIDTVGIVLVGLIFPAPLEVYIAYTFFAFQINIWAHFTLNEKTNSVLKRIIYILGNYHHHNIHHLNPKKNFGAFILLDYILNTQTNKYPSKS